MAENPGKLLRDRLEAKGWTQDELATVTGCSRQTISAIMAGRSGITADMAVRFAAAFQDTTPTDWLRWDAEYQLSLISTDGSDVGRRARLYELAPIRDMQKRGWIKETNNLESLESEIARFYGGAITEANPFSVSMRRSNTLRDLDPGETAWCFRARQLSEAMPLPAVFSSERMNAAERKLRQLAAYPKEAQRLSQTLAYYGIRFVVVEPLPGVEVDGAAFWHQDHPVIAVSARFDRIDALWFTVMHEFMHIKNGDEVSVDVNLLKASETGIVIGATNEEHERKANEQAADLLVPQAELDSFIKRVSPLYAAARIVQFAHRIKIHPGIIVGQLQHRGEVKYGAHRDLLVKIRTLVTETALTDGWGFTNNLGVT